MKNPFSGSHRPLAGRAVVLTDDVASSGHTVAQAARLLREAGASQIWSTHCIPHASNAVSIVPAVAAALSALVLVSG